MIISGLLKGDGAERKHKAVIRNQRRIKQTLAAPILLAFFQIHPNEKSAISTRQKEWQWSRANPAVLVQSCESAKSMLSLGRVRLLSDTPTIPSVQAPHPWACVASVVWVCQHSGARYSHRDIGWPMWAEPSWMVRLLDCENGPLKIGQLVKDSLESRAEAIRVNAAAHSGTT